MDPKLKYLISRIISLKGTSDRVIIKGQYFAMRRNGSIRGVATVTKRDVVVLSVRKTKAEALNTFFPSQYYLKNTNM